MEKVISRVQKGFHGNNCPNTQTIPKNPEKLAVVGI
jgi:hypothetical protein